MSEETNNQEAEEVAVPAAEAKPETPTAAVAKSDQSVEAPAAKAEASKRLTRLLSRRRTEERAEERYLR